jgi:hypothetical protein
MESMNNQSEIQFNSEPCTILCLSESQAARVYKVAYNCGPYEQFNFVSLFQL